MNKKFKIGVLGCGYACEKNLDKRLNPWFNLEEEYNIVFSFVSGRFKEYEDLNINQDNTKTCLLLKEYLYKGLIKYLEIPKEPLNEAETRNCALVPLLADDCDLIYLLDLSDEYYTEKQIINIFNYINREDNEFIAYFNTNFRNYIFSGKEWIDGFCPPRAFRVNYGALKLDSFYFDNDARYINGQNKFIDYKILPNNEISKKLAWIKHLTWTHENGRDKEIYQRRHFNNICSYKFNNETNKLEFDIDGYYKKFNIPVPEVYKD